MKKNDPQRIAILRHGYYPSDPRVFKEARALAEAGYEVDVLCLRQGGEPARATLDGVRVYRLGLTHRRGSKLRYMLEYGWSLFMMTWMISLLQVRRRYDLIQVNTLPDELVFATLLPKLMGARILLDMHEPTPELYLTKYGGDASLKAFHFHAAMEQRAIRFAHRVLTVNDALKRRYVERGADGGRITVVRNVPSEDVFGAAPATVRPDAGFCVLTHGTLQPRYGHDALLKAAPMLRAALPGFHLVILGEGETKPALQRLARETGCADVVEFVGTVPLNRVPDVLLRAHVGVVPLMPSPFSDLCQPNKLFEYVALNIPVVAARLPAMTEGFDDNSFLLFEPGNEQALAEAIIRMSRDPEGARKRAERAYALYTALRWRVCRDIYVKAVKGCLYEG